ncbi:RagB/SusD family nutrient uptake outer membrane protein [Arcticibacter sp. MXS-1]|uniref:RagB/SusD family nutrient uptake outer membrane protein n=1 Tax=Arcticibacter sp. MXS-1 TaxID=3341726 RepID=UPI0035A8353F
MKKNIIVILACFLSLAGCKDYLDVENPNQIGSDIYWTTAEDALGGVNAIYSTLHRTPISRWMPFYLVIRSDEGTSRSPASDIVNNMDRFQITDYNYGNMYGIWNDNYIGIFRANQVIDNVPAITMEESVKQRYLGEAKFLRALFYYNLVNLWGRVPLMLKTSNVNDLPVSSSATEVWAQVEQDLRDAAAGLPVSYADADKGRATKGAAYALLAKALMQQQKYSEALTPLQWLAEGEGKSVYSLMADYRDNFRVSTENNAESVFEWQFSENPAETGDDDTETPNQNTGSSLPQFWAPPEIGFSDGEALRWVIHEFTRENTAAGGRDPRLAASFLYDSTDVRGPEFTTFYGRTFATLYPNNANRDRAWFRKFLNDHWKSVEGFRSPNNWRFIRYADVLLMYAECLNATGNTAGAYRYVDQVRQRAGLAPLSTTRPGLTQPEFLQQLKHERITELSGEGHRWADLARWGDLGPQLAPRDPAFSTFVKGRSEFLPVPQREIDLNPNLSQNPGW